MHRWRHQSFSQYSKATGTTVMKLLPGFHAACGAHFLPSISALPQKTSGKTAKPYPKSQSSCSRKYYVSATLMIRASMIATFVWFRSAWMDERSSRSNTLKSGPFAGVKRIWAVGTAQQMTETSSSSAKLWGEALSCWTIIVWERWSGNSFAPRKWLKLRKYFCSFFSGRVLLSRQSSRETNAAWYRGCHFLYYRPAT